jgi:HK97 family phage prohead protease
MGFFSSFSHRFGAVSLKTVLTLTPKISMHHHRFSPFILHKSQEADGTFSGYASVFDVLDSHHERIAPTAFDESLKSITPKMLFQHDPLNVIGKWEEVRIDSYGLFVKGKFLLDIPKAQEAYALLRHGLIDDLSVGFISKKTSCDPKTKERVIEKAELMEISLVTFGANPKAKIFCVKKKETQSFSSALNPSEVEASPHILNTKSTQPMDAFLTRLESMIHKLTIC